MRILGVNFRETNRFIELVFQAFCLIYRHTHTEVEEICRKQQICYVSFSSFSSSHSSAGSSFFTISSCKTLKYWQILYVFCKISSNGIPLLYPLSRQLAVHPMAIRQIRFSPKTTFSQSHKLLLLLSSFFLRRQCSLPLGDTS